MESNLITGQINQGVEGIISSSALLNHWLGHRKLTRKVIDAFPEDQLFSYSLGGMRPFAAMVYELLDVAGVGIQDVVFDKATPLSEMQYHSGKSTLITKKDLLEAWDSSTEKINTLWPQIPAGRFQETIKAFGEFEGKVIDTVLYWIDNEIHHRAQGFVYLRSLGVEPPAFWDRY